MAKFELGQKQANGSTRRQFIRQLGLGMVAAGAAPQLLDNAYGTSETKKKSPKVKYRILGKTGLKISEIGFGGHSWSYKQVPDGRGDIERLQSMRRFG